MLREGLYENDFFALEKIVFREGIILTIFEKKKALRAKYFTYSSIISLHIFAIIQRVYPCSTKSTRISEYNL
jgi:hypothetical protein